MKNIHSILQKIIAKKRSDLSKPSNNAFRSAILTPTPGGVVILGEIKLASPTVPFLGSKKDITKRAVAYEKADVSALSVVTEKHYFKGNIAFIRQLKRNVNLPILQKDFVLDPYQVYESAMNGSDALLLIARIVDFSTLKRLVALCQKLGVEPVVEINDEKDLKKALTTSTLCIAVNARDLRTFEVDVDHACEVMKKIPDRYIKLGFSGIHSSVEVKKYTDAGARGVLVGTALMKATNINSFIKELRSV